MLHLVDATADDPVTDWRTVVTELDLYGGGLAAKPRVTVLNKVDALSEEAVRKGVDALAAASGAAVMAMSGATGQGVADVLRILRATIRADSDSEDGEAGPWSPI